MNCYNTGSVSSSSNSGGIIGTITGTNTIIRKCNNFGSISVSNSASSRLCSGGIVGYCQDASVYIDNCYNTGSISSSISYSNSNSDTPPDTKSHSGGIVGYNAGAGARIENSYNTGSISSYSYGISPSVGLSGDYTFGWAYSYSGGIVGYSESIILTKCYNKGQVTARATAGRGYYKFSYSGGLIGKGQGGISLSNSYNRGAVSAIDGNNGNNSQVGGIVGCIYSSYNSSFTISNSYNTGRLTGAIKGGIRGNSTGTVTNCYYLETCNGTVAGGTSKTDAAMKSASFPILLNADSTVFVMDLTPNVNDGYPIFGSSMVYAQTEEASDIQFTSATLHGTYYADYADIVGFEYKQNSASNYTTVYSNIGSPASYNLTGLQSGTTYNYRMFLQKDGVTYYGDVVNFNTLQCDIVAEIQIVSNSICAGDTAILTVNATSSLSDEFTYQWGNNATSAIIRTTEAGSYTVTVTDGNGCTTTASSTITVNPLPNGTISGNTSLCAGESSVLTASGANSYTWNTGASTPTLTVNESGTYTCTFRNSYGCTSTQSVDVTVFSSPVITGETAFCAGGSTTLTATGGNSYTWSNGATTPSITVSTPGTYSVTGTSTGGCSGSSSVTVVQRELPEVGISGTPVICSGIGAELTATEGSSYLWSTGETTQSITANHTGNYSVLVTDANGCSNTTSVEVGSLTSVAISGNTSICQGETAILSVEMEGEYLWSTGAQTSLISVSNAGIYSVTVSLPNGCSTSATANVNVNALPVPTITGNTTFCEGETTTLTANGGVSYRWSNNATAASITVGTAGLYSVTVTDAMGCSGSTYTTVAVNPLPNVSISGNTATCQGTTTTLTANGAQSYQWNTGSTNATISVGAAGNFTVTGYSAQGCANTASTSVTIYPTYNTPISHSMCQGETYSFFGQNLTAGGTYTHTLYSTHGCDSIITLTLTVNEVPVPTISGNTSICQGETSTLVANGGVSYNWSTGSTGSNLYVSESGAYTVTATNAQGCSATATTYVTVNELPTVTISGNTAICEGNTTTLTANGAATYQWSNGTNGANNTVDVFGNYTVTGTSAAGCSSTATTTVIVYSLPVINISGDTEICQGSSTTLTANGAESYIWNNGTTDASFTTSNAGTYTVIGTDEHGCYNTESVNVVVNYPTNEVIVAIECDNYTWNGITYTESGDYTWTGQTIHGCDSVVTLHLTINESVVTEVSEAAVSSYTWHGIPYTESGDYTWTGQTVTGCDSTVTLHLTITTGINENGLVFLSLYPNPTTDIVNVQYAMNDVQMGNSEIQLFDMYGRMLQVMGMSDTHGASLQTDEIDLTQYATGIYLVKLVNGGKVVAVRKVVKQ